MREMPGRAVCDGFLDMTSRKIVASRSLMIRRYGDEAKVNGDSRAEELATVAPLRRYDALKC